MVYTANWGIICHLPPFTGTWKIHWLKPGREDLHGQSIGGGEVSLRLKMLVYQLGFHIFSIVFSTKTLEKERITGWWFQIFFIFTLIWGRFPFWLYNIFQMGWNHQLDNFHVFVFGFVVWFFRNGCYGQVRKWQLCKKQWKVIGHGLENNMDPSRIGTQKVMGNLPRCFLGTWISGSKPLPLFKI